MLRSLSLTCGLSAVALVALSDFNRARAEALFHAVSVNSKLYESSFVYSIGLSEDGLLVTEEYNNDFRGFIQHFVFDSATEVNHRFDDVVGRPSRPMPAGLVGGARARQVGEATGFVYTFQGQGYVFRPQGAIGSASGITTSVPELGFAFNADNIVRADDAGRITLARLPSITDPLGGPITSITLPNIDPDFAYVEPNSINARSRVVGTYFDDQTPRGQRVFIWQPDLNGASDGDLVFPDIRTLHRGAVISARQSAQGETIVLSVSDPYQNPNAPYQAYRYSPSASGDPLESLNDLFGREWVNVFDINSAGAMVGEVADADGGNWSPFLYTLEDGFKPFTLSMLDIPAGENWTRFQPRFINDLGQIAGDVTYRETLGNGTTATRLKTALLTTIPEPAALMGFLAAITLLPRRR